MSNIGTVFIVTVVLVSVLVIVAIAVGLVLAVIGFVETGLLIIICTCAFGIAFILLAFYYLVHSENYE